jgi:predicted DNA-binding ribbon-helix-helix protein
VAIKAYGNTNFVNIMLERKFYKQLEETAKKLETTPDKLIYNAIRLILKSLSQ